MKTPSKCRTCGSSDLIWFTLRNTGGAQGEPLRMPEIAYDFILGCKGCSETLRVLRAEDVAEYLTLLRTLPDLQSAQTAPDDVFEEGQWWLAELDSIVASGTPAQKRAMAVVRNLLSCWQRTQAAAVPVGWQFYQDGKWWNGDDRVKDHRANTEAAGVPVRNVYAAPAQPALQAEQRPVGEMISNDGDIYWADRHPPMGTKLYAAPANPAEQQEQQPVAWGAFRFGGSRSGMLYSYCETEQQIDSYITDVHRSNDSITLRKAPLYTAPVALTGQQPIRLPERKQKGWQCEQGIYPADGWNAALDEVARLNASPIAHTEQSKVKDLREALAMFVHMAEYRLLELGILSPEMDKCLIKGRAALAASDGQEV